MFLIAINSVSGGERKINYNCRFINFVFLCGSDEIYIFAFKCHSTVPVGT